MSPKRKDVRELLLGMFTPEELRRFLGDFEDYDDFDDGINWNRDNETVADDVSRKLEDRGLLDSNLYERLLESRPRRKADIAAVFGGVERAGAPRQRALNVVNTPPVEVSRFAGRTREQADLRQFLSDPAVRMVGIVGRAGFGKSALASRVLGELEPSPDRTVTNGNGAAPDGILYLGGRRTGLSLESLYADLLRLLDTESARLLSVDWKRLDRTLAEGIHTLLDSLRGRRIVVLLDGLETENDVIRAKGLRTFVEVCLSRFDAPVLVVTARTDVKVEPGLVSPNARTLPLRDGLEPPAAVTLLRSLDPQGTLGLAEAEETVLARAAEVAGRIPRALEILAGILEQDPAASIARLLADERTLGDRVVDDLVTEGYQSLRASEQRVMEVLSVFEAPATEAAITYVVEEWYPEIDVGDSLRRLVKSYFATADRKTGRYLLQSTDRWHAYHQIPEAGVPAAGSPAPSYHRAAVESRVADHFESVRPPQEDWRSIQDLDPIISEYEHRVRAGEIDQALRVLELIDRDYLFLWGHFSRLVELRTMVLDQTASLSLMAANLASLGLTSQVLGDYDAALDYYEQAVELDLECGDKEAHVRHLGDLGRLYRNLGHMDKAIEATMTALNYATDQGDRETVGRWSDRLGLVYTSVGRLDEALALHDDALAVARSFGNRAGEGAPLNNRGVTLVAKGCMAEALAAFEESLRIMVEVGDRRGDVIVTGHLGWVAEIDGDYEKALALRRKSFDLAVELGERREQSYQLLGMGRARVGLGELDQAKADLRSARNLDVPETGYLAALSLSLLLARMESSESLAAFDDTIRRCRDRLERSLDLFSARYALGTALLGSASSASGWSAPAKRREALAEASAEYNQALQICAANGAVSLALGDLRQLADTGVDGLEPVLEMLTDAAAHPPTCGATDEGPARGATE